MSINMSARIPGALTCTSVRLLFPLDCYKSHNPTAQFHFHINDLWLL